MAVSNISICSCRRHLFGMLWWLCALFAGKRALSCEWSVGRLNLHKARLPSDGAPWSSAFVGDAAGSMCAHGERLGVSSVILVASGSVCKSLRWLCLNVAAVCSVSWCRCLHHVAARLCVAKGGYLVDALGKLWTCFRATMQGLCQVA